jgi:putative ABC transport system permease protein
MIKNYLKTAWRNLSNNKFYSAINIAGLTVGLVIGLFMLLWVQDELSFDAFNSHAPDIYKVGIVGGSGTTKQMFLSVIAPVATFAKNEITQVEDAVRIKGLYGNTPVKYKDKVFMEDKLAFTDPSYFTVFDFPIIMGDPHTPFADNSSVVITRSVARRYFGHEDPLGKMITLGKDEHLKVTGVINDYPANSTFKYNILIPLSRFNQLAYVERSTTYNGTGRIASMDADWISFNFQTYLLTKPHADIALLQKQLQHIHERNKPDDAPVPYLVQPLLKTHLYNADGTDAGIEIVKVFSIVAILILIIACINYVNLSTARSMLRAKEVSMRKIIGAGKWQLFMQFMIETTLLFFFATVLAIGLMYLLLPVYNQFSGKQLVLSLSNYTVWICILLTLAGTLIASSIYPAALLSSFEPLSALKGKVAGMGNAAFRRVLVVIQFSISIVLIIGTLVIGNQLKYIRNKNLGYDKENVFSFPMNRDMMQRFSSVKAGLLAQAGVTAVTRSGGNIIEFDNWTGDNNWDGKPSNSNLLLHPMQADKDFISFFKIKMAAGHNFTGDVADSSHFILNEAAIAAMGLKDPIGKKMRVWKTNGTIIGIVKDFHFASMRKKISPVVFIYDPANSYLIYVKTTGVKAQMAVGAAKAVWKQYNSNIPFNYTFLDESFNQLYQTEQRTGTLFNLFSAVAIIISCLGLFGLATYSAQVKTREIGIRKVLGASVAGITRLLATEFLLLIFISIVIAAPVAWYAMNKWLLDFAYRITIGGWVFVIAAVGAMVIALITISVQSIKAALANPVRSLRSE